MNYNKTISLCTLLLISNIMHAGIINKVIGTGMILYIHQNVMTKQDLTKTPTLTSDDINEYSNKFSATMLNTHKSLQPYFKAIEEFLKAKSSELSKTIESDQDGTDKNNDTK